MISVCMATYNGERYIVEQLVSILKQLGEEDEVIISDDGSKDKTLEVVKSLNDPRVKVFTDNKNHGFTGNFYNALSKAKGDYIFLSDQDDVWMDNKVAVVMDAFKTYDFVVSDAIEVDENLKEINHSRITTYGMKSGFWNNLLRSRYLGCCMAFKRNVLEGLFPPPTYENDYPHDLWIALIGEKYFKSKLIEQPLILYRRHGHNVSSGGKADKSNTRKLSKRIFCRFTYLKYVLKQRKVIGSSR